MGDKQSNWKVLASEEVADLKLFKARFDYMKNPRNGNTDRMIILESPDAANVIAITADQHLLFAKQYRFGISAETIEIPGGIVDPGEEQAVAAQRELREETGYVSDKWTYLGKVPSNPVFMTSYIHHWLAEDVRLEHQQELDDGEAVEVVKIPITEVKEKLATGYFQHPHTVNALILFFAKQKELF